jgi:hypothetical protein
MRLAKSRGPGCSRLALILIGCGLLAGCASVWPSEPPPEARAEGWRVVERLGEARYLAPEASGWSPATPATTLPSGSKVTTGAGGRVILARAGDHISVGPTSRLSLPSAEGGGVLRQDAGWLRYRVAETPADPLMVATPFLEIEVRGTVFDVTVGPLATEVAVEHGQVRIATPDGLRQIELEAGQSAYAGGSSGGLVLRHGPGEPAEQVETIVLPAMQPNSGAIEGRSPAGPLMVEAPAAHRASTSGTAASQAAVPIATATLPVARGTAAGAAPQAGAPRGGATRAASRSEAERAGAAQGRTEESAADLEPMPALVPADPAGAQGPVRGGPRAAPPVGPLDRLTEGMIDAVPAAPRPAEAPPYHARSI